MDIRLDGKVAVVTGASHGIGKGIASALAASGAAVMIVGRNAEPLTAAAGEIRAETASARVETFVGDAGQPEVAAACVRATVEHLGGLDILVNNAPPGGHGMLTEVPVETMLAAARSGPVAVVCWIREAWEAWMREHGGAVVNITSVGTEVVERRLAFYAAVKAGIVQVTSHFAVELGPGVRVNAVAPGWILARGADTGFAQHAEKLGKMLPLQRCGTPADIANAVVFLASDAASYITGQVLPVEGGRLSAYGLFTIGTAAG